MSEDQSKLNKDVSQVDDESYEEEDDDDDDDDSSQGDKDTINAKDFLQPSTAATRKKERLRNLVRKGAPFCGLQLFKINKTDLPGNLPLPPRLVALDLPISDLESLLHHLRPPASASIGGQGSQQTTPGPTPVPSSSRLSKDRSTSSLRRKSITISPSPPTQKNASTLLTPGWRPRKR